MIVDFGKRGAQLRVAKLDGAHVRITGSLLHRDGRSIIEIGPDASDVAELGSPARTPPPPAATRADALLTGEIVDTKCFLGAMKPGEGKTHKACAIRCIAGGIPPTLVSFDPSGAPSYYTLADTDGNPINQQVLDVVGEPVQVRARLERRGDIDFALINPKDIRRSSGGAR